MKKLLIIGSDFGTIDIVKEAKKMGLWVIVADYFAYTPTKDLADESWTLSTTDIDALEQKCREENVSAIAYGASDFNIGNVRILCKRLNLPVYCSDDYAWKVSRDKSEFKKVCLEVGAPVAKGYKLTDALSRAELDQIVYPVIVKPVDLSGNRGMSYCYNEEQLIAGYRKARELSKNPTIVCERMLKGPELYVNYAIANGEAKLLYYTAEHNQPGQLHNMYSIINTTNVYMKTYLDEVNEKVKDVFKAIGCTEGIAWIETIMDQDGHFYLLEMGYRFGGEMIYVPWEKVSGFNSVRWMIETALGVKHTSADLPKDLEKPEKQVAATYYMFCKRDGIVGSIEGLDYVKSLKNVNVDFPKRVGNTIRKDAPMGILEIYAKDCEDLCNTITDINKNLIIKDGNGEDLIVIFDDFKTLKDEYEVGLKEFD